MLGHCPQEDFGYAEIDLHIGIHRRPIAFIDYFSNEDPIANMTPGMTTALGPWS
jgi:hypothetical protein